MKGERESMAKGGRRFRKVAVLKGGFSAEREVSLRSGAAVAKGLREAGYEVEEVEVKDAEPILPRGVEAAFVALHGEFGEDGGIQRRLSSMGIPYTGSDPKASEAAFDKVLTKKLLQAADVPTPRYELVRKGGRRTMPLPVVVKPPRQGSSIGVSKVFSETQWPGALADALKYDTEAMVEEYISGRELTVGIVGDTVLPVVEIVAPGGWYDYTAKYTSGQSEYRVPAPLDEDTVRRCSRAAMGTFKALGCRGMGRVDIRLREDGAIFVLELNNIPGFTETSLLPKSAREAGISFPELCARIMELAEK